MILALVHARRRRENYRKQDSNAGLQPKIASSCLKKAQKFFPLLDLLLLSFAFLQSLFSFFIFSLHLTAPFYYCSLPAKTI